MKIFLGGGGSEKDSFLLDRAFADSLTKKKVLYLPIAMSEEKYSDCFNWVKSALAQHGILEIDLCVDLRDLTENSLEHFGAIYIGGGNTFRLLKLIRDSNFDFLLKQFLEAGGVVYGGSAGAIIFGKSIITSGKADKNDVGLNEFSGLNLLNGYSVWCHYSPQKDEDVIELIDECGLILAIEECGGVLFEKSFKRICGKNYLFKKGSSKKSF
jgi:dipeptidase E